MADGGVVDVNGAADDGGEGCFRDRLTIVLTAFVVPHAERLPDVIVAYASHRRAAALERHGVAGFEFSHLTSPLKQQRPSPGERSFHPSDDRAQAQPPMRDGEQTEMTLIAWPHGIMPRSDYNRDARSADAPEARTPHPIPAYRPRALPRPHRLSPPRSDLRRSRAHPSVRRPNQPHRRQTQGRS